MTTDRRRFLTGSVGSGLCLAGAAAVGSPLRPDADQAVWQYHVDMSAQRSHAYLWTPPRSKRLRGLIMGQTIVIEKALLEDPAIRAMAAREDFGLIWFNRNWGNRYVYSEPRRDDRVVQGALDALAALSGFEELTWVPWVTIGHSASQAFAFNPAYQNPDRVLCIISAKAGLGRPPEWDKTASLRHTPVLQIGAELFELGPARRLSPIDTTARQMAEHARTHPDTVSMGLTQTGSGHFEWSPDLGRYVAAFISAAAKARLPEALTRDFRFNETPERELWLVDSAVPPRFAAAPAPLYQGPRETAMRVFNGHLAKALSAFYAGHNKRPVWISFDHQTPSANGQGLQTLDFTPEADGLSFSVSARLQRDDSDTGGSAPRGGLHFRVVGWGWSCVRTGPATFRVQFNRAEDNIDKILILAEYPGDRTHRPVVQPVLIRIPLTHDEGLEQTLSFDALPDVASPHGRIRLNARSSVGLPVSFFVRSGPVLIEDAHYLRFADVPAHARFPLRIEVVATQWGRATGPAVKTATPVSRVFYLHRPH
ncbi:hypothetical protein PQU94_05305 [Asticcacaulis sp. DXS10W]|uniref:Uncharacterized protein n=1 Tax=Asticcacaulis currens TaxID=2984210 RepID=A0ABT5IBX3_9CAUL|nr:hypothetical protein [Asticcacaulis currens]MDC7693696.1 hypothetical protein [Asticcacaulis currens]